MRRSDITNINNLVFESSGEIESKDSLVTRLFVDYTSGSDLVISKLDLLRIPAGAPDVVYGDFICRENKLTSLKGSPRECMLFDASYNKLTSLEGSPDTVERFTCMVNMLTNLKGGPTHVHRGYDVRSNDLTSLEGAPSEVVHFNCSNNKLQDLRGGPLYVSGNFRCVNNPLKSLEGAPEYIGGEFVSDIFTAEDYREFAAKRKYKRDAIVGTDDEAGIGNILDIL